MQKAQHVYKFYEIGLQKQNIYTIYTIKGMFGSIGEIPGGFYLAEFDLPLGRGFQNTLK